MRSDHALSQTTGSLVCVGITILLALMVLLAIQIPDLSVSLTAIENEPPAIFVVTGVIHESEEGVENLDSRVVLLHNGSESYPNRDLWARMYRNDELLDCRIETLNGHDFISTRHDGVQYLSGSGCRSDAWNPGERILIDFTDGTFRPGDLVTAEVLGPDGILLSRHSYIA